MIDIEEYMVRNNLPASVLSADSGFNESAIYHWQADRRRMSVAAERYLLLLEQVRRESGEWPLNEDKLNGSEKRWHENRKNKDKK